MWQPGNRGSKQNTNYRCCEIYFYGHTNNNNCDYDNNNDNGKKNPKTNKTANISWLL